MSGSRHISSSSLQSFALRRLALAAALLVSPAVLAAQGAAASDVAAPDTAGCRRCLGGHRYLTSIVVPDPFVTTHFRSSVGGGSVVGLEAPFRNLDGVVIDTVGGDVKFVTLDFEYQYAATHWLGVRAGASVQARVGTSPRALVSSGAEALNGTSLGVTGRVWGTPTAQLSLTADYRHNDVYLVDPYSFAQEVRDNGYTAVAQDLLLRTAAVNRYTGGVRGAWTIRPWVGLNANFEAGVADEAREGEGKQSVTDFGALAGFDFANLSRWPIGLTLGGRHQNGTGRGEGISGKASTFELGLFYTGRPHFLIGAESTWSTTDFAQAEVANADVFQIRLITRYDF